MPLRVCSAFRRISNDMSSASINHENVIMRFDAMMNRLNDRFCFTIDNATANISTPNASTHVLRWYFLNVSGSKFILLFLSRCNIFFENLVFLSRYGISLINILLKMVAMNIYTSMNILMNAAPMLLRLALAGGRCLQHKVGHEVC